MIKKATTVSAYYRVNSSNPKVNERWKNGHLPFTDRCIELAETYLWRGIGPLH
jgi:hypothetical protein